MIKCRLFKVIKYKTRNIGAGTYLRELSIVIIGVAVTFFISDIISTAKEKKDLTLQLNAIYIELEDNLENVNQLIKLYNNHNRLGGLLRQTITEPEQVNKDSLRKYEISAGHMDLFSYHKAAYEMFVNNGGMKLLPDRELLLEIAGIYAMLEAAERENSLYNALKIHEIQQLYKLDSKRFVSLINITDPEYSGLFNFYVGVGTGFKSKEAKERIESLLSRRRSK